MSELARLSDEVVEVARKERSDKGSIKITERDLAILRFVGEQYAVRADQLARLLKRPAPGTLSESATRAVIARWEKAGLTQSKKVVADEPRFVWLTRRGLDEMGLAFKPWSPTAASLAHIFWTNQVRLYAEERHPDLVWQAERYMRAGKPMQTILDSASHLADGELRSEDAVVGIEAELTSKSAPRRESIMKMLAEAYATVWYFAPPNVLPTVRPYPGRGCSGDRIRRGQDDPGEVVVDRGGLAGSVGGHASARGQCL